jgi:formate hydrogenlyase subunit 6/NADH:ubiquinone oxidoreductase subunit I
MTVVSSVSPAKCVLLHVRLTVFHIVPDASPWEEGKERYPVRFDIDLLRCIYCGFCEIACPEEAIELTEIYDFADYTRESFLIDKDGLLEVYEMTKDENFYLREKENAA